MSTSTLRLAAGSTGETGNELLQYLAVGAHPDGRTKTVIGEIVTGVAMVQIWSAPYATDSKASSVAVLPEMQLGICHEGGLTWDCKWCPSDTSTQATATQDCLPRSASAVHFVAWSMVNRNTGNHSH